MFNIDEYKSVFIIS